MDNTKLISFAANLFNFVNQTVKGTVLAGWRVISNEGAYDKVSQAEVHKILLLKHFFLKNLIQYINSCWRNRLGDSYVREKVALIGSFGGFTHESCTLLRIFELSSTVLRATLDEIRLEDLDSHGALSDRLLKLIDKELATRYEDVLGYVGKCGDCQVPKDGEDLIFVVD